MSDAPESSAPSSARSGGDVPVRRACMACWHLVPPGIDRCPECGGQSMGAASWKPPSRGRVAGQYGLLALVCVVGFVLLVVLTAM